MTLWEIDVHPATGQVDTSGKNIASEARDLGLDANLTVAAAHGFLLQGDLTEEQAKLATRLLADSITESTTVARLATRNLQTVAADLHNSSMSYRNLESWTLSR